MGNVSLQGVHEGHPSSCIGDHYSFLPTDQGRLPQLI